MEEFGDSAFFYCKSLKNVSLPEGLKVIGAYCFKQSGLLEINVPKTVKKIFKEAFNECTKLKKVSPLKNVEVGEDAFPAHLRGKIIISLDIP